MQPPLECLLLLVQKLIAVSMFATDEAGNNNSIGEDSIPYHIYSSVRGVFVLGCLLVDADNFHLNFMDIRVIISWLLKIECKYTLSNAADIIIWIFQKVFRKSLALPIGNDFPVCNIWRSVDIIHEQFVLNCSKRFLEKLMLCIEHNRRIPSKSSAKLNIERKQFVSFPVDLERSFSPMDASSDVEVLAEWKLSDVSDAILNFIHKGCSAQSMIAALKLTFWSVYKASELQYLVYASNTTVPMPNQQLHLTFRLPVNAYEDADTARFSECLPDLLWKWSTPASATFFSETPAAIDTSRAFCLKLAWERALAAAILIQRCSLAANANLPAKIVGKETARFLCQIHSSRLMLRSAHTNAAANERRGATRTAPPSAEEEEILFSTQGKLLHIYLNRLLLLMNENVLTSTISYMVSEDVVTQAILLPYNWSSDVGLAVVSALLYKIIRVDSEVSMHEADSTLTSSVYDIIQSTLAENDIEWDAKPIDLEKIPISCGLGLDRRYTVEFMSELETIEKARVQEQQKLLKQYFSIFLCWIPAICVQIDLARRSYLPSHGYHESADEMYGSQLDIVGYKIFLLNLLCFLEMELLAIAGDGSLHSHHWVSQLASNLVKSFLLVKEEVDTIVSTTVLKFDENYQAFNEFAANLDTENVPAVSGLHTIYFILKFLQRFNQDSTIAVAVLRILQICSPFPAHLRSVSWAMARELHTEHMNFANSLISSHDSNLLPPGMDELLPYILHLTSGDDVRSAVLDEVVVACTPRDKFTNLLDLLDSALRLPTKGKLTGDCGLQNFLTTWMYWWSFESTTGRLYGVLQCLVDVFKCILADDIEVGGQEANIMSHDKDSFASADLFQSSGSHHKPIAFEFPSLTLETLSFHLKLSLAMLPALFALEEPKVKDSSPYEDFFNVSKLATAFYRDFTTVLQEKEEHLWIILETAPFMVKHSKATLQGIHRYLDRAVEWRLIYRTGSSGFSDDTGDCDQQSCMDYGSVEFLREALEFALMVTVSILVYWKAFDMVILKSRRYEYPKSLSRGVPSVEQACADLAARVSTLANTLSLELQSVDLPTPSEAVSYLSTVLVKELRHVVIDHHRMASLSWVDSSNGGSQEPSSSSTSAGEDASAHCDYLVAGEMEESAAVDGFDNGFSAITTNDGDGWGLYNEE